MKSDSWFCCYPADLIADTQHLSNHDFGAYWRLICFYYLHGPLPNDDDALRNVAKCEQANWSRCRGIVLKFFPSGADGLLHNKRADEEILDREARDSRRRAQTRAGREALGTTVIDTVNSPVTAVQPQPQPHLQLQPDPQPQKDVGRAGALPGGESDRLWLAALSKSEAYKHINVPRELEKMVLWCQENRKKPTRKRLLAWLNRIDDAIAAPRKGPHVPNI